MNISILASALVNNIIQFEVTAKLFKKKINHSSLNYIFSILILTLYVYISYNLTDTFIRTIILLYVFIVCIYMIFIKENIKLSQIIIISFLNWFIFLFSEIIFAILTTSLFKLDYKSINVHFFGNFLSNCLISLIYVLLTINKFSKKLIEKIIKKYINSKVNVIIVFSTLSVMVLSITFYLSYFKINFLLTLLFDFIVLITYIFVTFKLFDEKYKTENLKFEYNILLDNLNEYEKMLDYQKVSNHENKNQLLVIKGMLKKGEEGIEEYIDSIIKEKHEDNDEFLFKTNKIPEGGLRGLIYYKVLTMKEKNINVSLDISSSIRKIKLNINGIDLNKDLCKILGVFLDNSIQAVENLLEKNIEIKMEYKDKKYIISIANNFTGNLDISNIDEIGYTTKGKGHGYGLSLVKKIIENNEYIQNQKMITGNVFKQVLIIDINEKNKKTI